MRDVILSSAHNFWGSGFSLTTGLGGATKARFIVNIRMRDHTA